MIFLVLLIFPGTKGSLVLRVYSFLCLRFPFAVIAIVVVVEGFLFMHGVYFYPFLSFGVQMAPLLLSVAVTPTIAIGALSVHCAASVPQVWLLGLGLGGFLCLALRRSVAPGISGQLREGGL